MARTTEHTPWEGGGCFSLGLNALLMGAGRGEAPPCAYPYIDKSKAQSKLNSTRLNAARRNSIQLNSTHPRFNASQFNPIQFNRTRVYSIQRISTQTNLIRFSSSSAQLNPNQHNSVQFNSIQFNSIQESIQRGRSPPRLPSNAGAQHQVAPADTVKRHESLNHIVCSSSNQS